MSEIDLFRWRDQEVAGSVAIEIGDRTAGRSKTGERPGRKLEGARLVRIRQRTGFPDETVIAGDQHHITGRVESGIGGKQLATFRQALHQRLWLVEKKGVVHLRPHQRSLQPVDGIQPVWSEDDVARIHRVVEIAARPERPDLAVDRGGQHEDKKGDSQVVLQMPRA